MIIKGEEVFVIDMPSTNDVLVYAPLRNYLAKADARFKEYIKTETGVSEFLEILKKRKYIDINKIHNHYSRRMPFLSLPITDDCSLRCKYCYFRAGDDDKKNRMTKEQIKMYVDSYFSQLDDSYIYETDKIINVAIAGGGEPTKDFETMKFALLYVKKKAEEQGFKTRFTMPTNGFYGDNIRKFIVENFYQVSLSFDGPKDIQNFQRPCLDGSGSFETVFKTAQYFYDHNFPFGFRLTISKYAVNRLIEIIDFFNDNFPGTSIAMERMSEFGRVHQSGIESLSLEEFKVKLTEAYKYAYKIGVNLKNASLGKVNSLRTVFCQSVAVPNWTILTDGRITSCTRDSYPNVFTFGKCNSITQRLEIDEEKLKKLRMMNVFNYDECTECFAKYNCAGDCPNLRVANLVDCDANRKLLSERFLFLINKGKGGI